MFSQIDVKTIQTAFSSATAVATLGHGPILLRTRFLRTPSHSFSIVLATQSPGDWVGNTAVLLPCLFHLCSNVRYINWNSLFSDIWACGVAVGNTALLPRRIGSNPRLRIRALSFALSGKRIAFSHLLNMIVEITSLKT